MDVLDAIQFLAAIFGIAMGIEWLLCGTEDASKKSVVRALTSRVSLFKKIEVRISAYASASPFKKVALLDIGASAAPAFQKTFV